MAKRTGVPSLISTARVMCQLLVKFAPLIKTLYPSNMALQVALDAALVACQALEAELMVIREIGD